MTTIRFPRTLGACADRLYELRRKRLEMQRAVDAVEAEERALRTHVIDTLPKSEASGVAGRVARVTVVTKVVPQIDDWPAFYQHVKRTGQFDLLQRRVAESAIQARWEEGKEVPGVGRFTVVTLSVNKT